MRLKTERMIICKFDESMIESVHLNSLDEDNRRYVPDEVFETIEEAEDTVKFLMSRYDHEKGPFVYPILLQSGENIGYVQAIEIDEGWEIGYHIAKAYTSSGYSTEALKAFLPFISAKLKVYTFYGICLEENIASQRVLEKCGFELIFKGLSSYQNNEKMILKYRYSI